HGHGLFGIGINLFTKMQHPKAVLSNAKWEELRRWRNECRACNTKAAMRVPHSVAQFPHAAQQAVHRLPTHTTTRRKGSWASSPNSGALRQRRFASDDPPIALRRENKRANRIAWRIFHSSARHDDRP